MDFASSIPKNLPSLPLAFRGQKSRLYSRTYLAIQLMMLTFVRTSELIEATWDKIDLEDARYASKLISYRSHIKPVHHCL
jgi:integrase